MSPTKRYYNADKMHTNRVFLIGLGLAILAISAYYLLFAAKIINLECKRTSGNFGSCVISEKSLLFPSSKTLQLSDILTTRMDSKYMGRGKGGNTITGYQIIFTTKSGDVPLSYIYSRNMQNVQNILAKINVFLMTQTQPSISIQEDERWQPLLIGGLLFIFGIIPIIAALFAKR